MTDLVPRDASALSPTASGGPAGSLQVYWTSDTEVWWQETGRIRMGYSTPGKRGGKVPHTLDRFRLTSPQRDVVEELAVLYGGEVEPWEDAPYGIPQAQVVVEAQWLDVQVPEVKAGHSQYELWGLPEGQTKGAPVCLRRCNGQWDEVSGGGCICISEGVWEATQADPEQGDGEEYVLDPNGQRACKRFTRLNLVMSESTNLGVWRLQTTGKTAGNQLVTFMRYWLPRLPAYARLQLGITTVPRPYRDERGAQRVALVRVPTLRAHPEGGQKAGDLLAGAAQAAAVPAVVAEVAARATTSGEGAPPGTDAAPPSGVGPGPGDGTAAVADRPAPPSQDDGTPSQGAPREAAAETGQREPTRPTHPPGRPEDSPVFRAILDAGLAHGVARLFLEKQVPALFGPGGQCPLPTIAELAAIPGDPADRRTLAWAALDALRRQFTGMHWPDIPEGG